MLTWNERIDEALLHLDTIRATWASDAASQLRYLKLIRESLDRINLAVNVGQRNFGAVMGESCMEVAARFMERHAARNAASVPTKRQAAMFRRFSEFVRSRRMDVAVALCPDNSAERGDYWDVINAFTVTYGDNGPIASGQTITEAIDNAAKALGLTSWPEWEARQPC